MDFQSVVSDFYPFSLMVIALFVFALALFIQWGIKRDSKILRYREIANTSQKEINHHGEAVSIRHELQMTHDEILTKALKIIERNRKLLVNNPA
jgi:hypothetical protein